MQRRHFIIIAQTIKNLGLESSLQRHVAKCFAARLAETNINFKRETFLRACGVDTD